MAPTELRRFTTRYGARALLDEASRWFRDAGLGYISLDDDQIFDRLMANPSLLRLPLVRVERSVVVGVDERGWKEALTTA